MVFQTFRNQNINHIKNIEMETASTSLSCQFTVSQYQSQCKAIQIYRLYDGVAVVDVDVVVFFCHFCLMKLMRSAERFFVWLHFLYLWHIYGCMHDNLATTLDPYQFINAEVVVETKNDRRKKGKHQIILFGPKCFFFF